MAIRNRAKGSRDRENPCHVPTPKLTIKTLDLSLAAVAALGEQLNTKPPSTS